MEVLKVTDVTDTNAISHELVLVKVATKPQNRQEVMLAGQIYDAQVRRCNAFVADHGGDRLAGANRVVPAHGQAVWHSRDGTHRTRWRCPGEAALYRFATVGLTGPASYRLPQTETILEMTTGSRSLPV